jgi:hypothetical protein
MRPIINVNVERKEKDPVLAAAVHFNPKTKGRESASL